MHYIYLIRSIKYPDQIYFGCTQNLKRRLAVHNSGGTFHTAKYRPWEFVVCLAFKSKDTAIAFEKYLKSSSGRAFANKRFWQ